MKDYLNKKQANQEDLSMSKIAVLEYDVREKVNKAENKGLMKNGYLLGNINGKGVESIAIALKKDVFRKTLKEFGRNAVIKLSGKNDNSVHVMIKTIQTNMSDYSIHHVDFQQVQLTEKVTAEVALKYTGTEFLEGKRMILNRLVDNISVIGYPQDIPEVIELDVSKMVSGDNIYIKDLAFSKDIKPEQEEDTLIGSVIGATARNEASEGDEEVSAE